MTATDYTVQTLELKLKVSEFRQYWHVMHRFLKKWSVMLFSLVLSLIQAIPDENWFSQFPKTWNSLEGLTSTSRWSPISGRGCLCLYYYLKTLVSFEFLALKLTDLCHLAAWPSSPQFTPLVLIYFYTKIEPIPSKLIELKID